MDADGTGHHRLDTSVTRRGYRRGTRGPGHAGSRALGRLALVAVPGHVTRPDKTVAEQLRLEVGEVKSGVDPHALELLVAHGRDGPGQDLLHVDAGGTVTIPGGLVVEGFTTVSGDPRRCRARPR